MKNACAVTVGAEGHAYLDNVVGIVEIWTITAKREGEKKGGDMSMAP